VRYEVSAYARAGFECQHNLNYWRFGDYLGVGAGAHGKISLGMDAGIVRTVQWREPRRYMSAAPVVQTRSRIATRDLPFEFMLNALRLVEGFEMESFEARTGLPWHTVADTVARLVRRGLVEANGERCRPTAHGLSFLNDALLAFLPERATMTELSAMSTAS
jgi:oxygen-independent coproporphyrinogen-3 oxidase